MSILVSYVRSISQALFKAGKKACKIQRKLFIVLAIEVNKRRYLRGVFHLSQKYEYLVITGFRFAHQFFDTKRDGIFQRIEFDNDTADVWRCMLKKRMKIIWFIQILNVRMWLSAM